MARFNLFDHFPRDPSVGEIAAWARQEIAALTAENDALRALCLALASDSESLLFDE